MQIQLIRSATIKLDYSGSRFLIDPCLAPKHTMLSTAGISLNPLVDLPCKPEEVVNGIDAALVSHLHDDHIDPLAEQLLPKDLPVFCQPDDDIDLKQRGFTNVSAIDSSKNFNKIKISKVDCRHGTGSVLQAMGKASGFVFQSEYEPTLYWAGDTVWDKSIAEIIDRYNPAVIVTHSCGAKWENELIVMDDEQTVQLCGSAPDSIVIAAHMDSLDHATVNRKKLRKYAVLSGVSSERLLIPVDGEIIKF